MTNVTLKFVKQILLQPLSLLKVVKTTHNLHIDRVLGNSGPQLIKYFRTTRDTQYKTQNYVGPFPGPRPLPRQDVFSLM